MSTYVELPHHLQGLTYEEQCKVRREDADRRAEERRWSLHGSGVHVECKPMGRYGGDAPNSCKHAGTVGRVHSHDYEGRLVCGCVESSTVEGS